MYMKFFLEVYMCSLVSKCVVLMSVYICTLVLKYVQCIVQSNTILIIILSKRRNNSINTNT